MAKNNPPRHVGFIPDGNRRWAMDHGLPKETGYDHGINPGFLLYELCKEYGSRKLPFTAAFLAIGVQEAFLSKQESIEKVSLSVRVVG